MPGSDKYVKMNDPQFWSSRDTTSINQNSYNTAFGKPPSSMMQIPTQNMPPSHHIHRIISGKSL
jgi:hypothetical protein